MQANPRNGASIDRIYLHTNEGPQGPNAATNLVDYLQRIDAGYHVVVDDQHTVYAATDSQIVWAEGGDNTHALSVCMIGYSASTDWNSPYSQAMVERAAQQVAVWCRQYNVPTTRVRPGAPGQAPTDRGIAEHADDHDPHSEGHTDPGAGFPIDLFILRVYTILHPAPVIDWHAISILAAWEQRVAADPLELDKDPDHPARPLDTKILRDLLIKHGYGYELEPGTVYGPATARAVAQFKSKAKLANRIGEICAGPCARALLSPVS